MSAIFNHFNFSKKQSKLLSILGNINHIWQNKNVNFDLLWSAKNEPAVYFQIKTQNVNLLSFYYFFGPFYWFFFGPRIFFFWSVVGFPTLFSKAAVAKKNHRTQKCCRNYDKWIFFKAIWVQSKYFLNHLTLYWWSMGGHYWS